MQIPILVQLEAILEATLSHLKDGVLDGFELGLDFGVVFAEIAEGAEDFKGFSVAASENEPGRA
jgi:hypothetical protein